LAVLAIVAIVVIFVAVGVAWLLKAHAPATPCGGVALLPAITIQGALEFCIVAFLIAALPRLSGFSLRDLGFAAPTASQIGVATLGALAMILLVNGSAAAIDAFLHTKHEQDVVRMLRCVSDRPTLVVFAVFATIIAPLAEEFIFRIFVFNIGLRYGGFWVAAIVSAALFGLSHGDLIAFAPLMLGGVILSYVYYSTRNAYMSMITHGLFNAATVLTLVFAPQLTK